MTEPHPDVARLVAQFAADHVPTYDAVGVLKARAIAENVTRSQGPSPAVASVRDILIPGADGLLPVRVYDPDPGRSLPLVIYLHGGGFVLGSVRATDRPCRRLALAAGCVVTSVEYRRAPETKFPGPLLDCVVATRWLAMNAEALGSRPDGITLFGDSAGGNLAAACTLALRDDTEPVNLAAQILLYPTLAPARGSRFGSYREFADGPLMTRRELEWFWDLYLRTEADAHDPLAAPLLAPELSGVPPATIIVAELDPLRDEGLAYATRLQAEGVEVTTTVYPGAAHGFWWMDGEMSQAAELTAQLAAVIGRAGAVRG